MMQMSIFAKPTGRQLRNAGMAKVTLHNSAWAADATKLIEMEFQFLVVQSMFTGEDLHQWLEDAGLEAPDHPNAWSAVIGAQLRRWLKDGTIVQAGAITAHRPEAHGRLIRRYQKVAK